MSQFVITRIYNKKDCPNLQHNYYGQKSRFIFMITDRDFIMISWDLMMTGRDFIMNGWDFHDNRSRFFCFSILVFFHEHSRITELQGKTEDISSTPYYHFHLLHKYLDISQAIAAESSPLHIASSRTQTGNPWFPSTSR